MARHPNNARFWYIVALILVVNIGLAILITRQIAEREMAYVTDCLGAIQKGMDESDVDAIMGRKADYTGKYAPEDNRIDKWWLKCGHRFDVEFTGDGKVVAKDCVPLASPTLSDRWKLFVLHPTFGW
jgi:hypothetical protein